MKLYLKLGVIGAFLLVCTFGLASQVRAMDLSLITSYSGLIIGKGVTFALSSLLPNYSIISQGDLMFDTTYNGTPDTWVDSNNVQSYSGSEVLPNRPLNFRSNGFQSGASVRVDGQDRLHIVPFTFSATGGNVKVGGGAKYNTAIVGSPLSTTGAIFEISAECGNVTKQLPMDGSFVKAGDAGSGTALTNFSNVLVGTGSWIYWGTGRTLWNPADRFKMNTLTTPGAIDCKGYITLFDLYGK